MATMNLLNRVGAKLATPLLPNAYAELINPLWGEGVRAEVVAIEPEGPQAVSLTLKPNHRWQGARAGQHVRLGVDIKGVRHQRCYSLTSADSTLSQRITLTVQRHPHGLVSQYINHGLRVGDVVHVAPAQGEFVLPANDEPLLLITGGSGITPVMGFLRQLAEQGWQAPILHWHFAPNAEVSLFKTERQALAKAQGWQLHEAYPEQGDEGFSAAKLDELFPQWRNAHVYVCGPAGLANAVVALHEEEGRGPLVQEFFQPPAIVATGEGGEVTFTRANKTVQAPATTNLLEAAEAAGLTPEHGCRMGICYGCLTTLESGQVRDHAADEIIDAEGALVRICVCTAEGNAALAL